MSQEVLYYKSKAGKIFINEVNSEADARFKVYNIRGEIADWDYIGGPINLDYFDSICTFNNNPYELSERKEIKTTHSGKVSKDPENFGAWKVTESARITFNPKEIAKPAHEARQTDFNIRFLNENDLNAMKIRNIGRCESVGLLYPGEQVWLDIKGKVYADDNNDDSQRRAMYIDGQTYGNGRSVIWGGGARVTAKKSGALAFDLESSEFNVKDIIIIKGKEYIAFAKNGSKVSFRSLKCIKNNGGQSHEFAFNNSGVIEPAKESSCWQDPIIRSERNDLQTGLAEFVKNQNHTQMRTSITEINNEKIVKATIEQAKPVPQYEKDSLGDIVVRTIELNNLDSSKFKRKYNNEQIIAALDKLIKRDNLTDLRHIKANAAGLMLQAFENNNSAPVEIATIDNIKTNPMIMPAKKIIINKEIP